MQSVKDRTDKGIIREASDLYERFSGEATSLAKRDAEAAQRMGPVAKALFATCIITVMLAAVTLVYGLVKFPDAPIRETSQGYSGKQGAPHTREDYERFKLWEKLLIASFAAAFLTGFGAAGVEKASQRRARKPIK
jgi:hypothetical protein